MSREKIGTAAEGVGRPLREAPLLLLLRSSGLHRRHHPVHSWLQLLGIASAPQEKYADIEGSTAEIAISLRQRRASGSARCRNRLRKLNGVHAAACPRLMRIQHEPQAIASVCNVVGGDYRPSAAVCGRRLLTAPQLCLGDICRGLGEPVLIQENLVQPALPHEVLDFRERLVPIEVGVIYQEVARPSHTEHIQEWKIIWIGPYGRGK